jgi:ABC-type nitrate/sulfonate/bicarbonate transport system substrate-binding protein
MSSIVTGHARLVRRLAALGCAIALLAVAGCGSGGSSSGGGGGSGGSGDDTLTIGVQSLILQTYYPQLADALGELSKQKLKIKVIVGESTSNGVQGLLGGSIDAYFGGPEGLIANQKGADLRFVAAGANRSAWDLVTTKDISKPKDLEGKVVGVSAIDSISTVTVQEALAAQGVDLKKIKFVVAGGTAKRFVALQSKRVQGAPLGIPINFQATQKDGLKDLGRTDADLGAPPLCSVVLTVRKSWANGHRDQLRRFLKAYQATLDALYDPAQRQKIVGITAKGLAVDPKFMDSSLKSLFSNPSDPNASVPKNGQIDKKALLTSAQAFQKYGGLPKDADLQKMVDQAVDMSYLEDAQKS